MNNEVIEMAGIQYERSVPAHLYYQCFRLSANVFDVPMGYCLYFLQCFEALVGRYERHPVGKSSAAIVSKSFLL